MEKRREILINYIKTALKKGYSEQNLRKNLLNNGVSWVEAASLLTVAKKELGINGTQEEVIEKSHSNLVPILIALAGLLGMIIIYFYRMLNDMFNYSVLGPLNAVWPLIFPIISNVVNLIFFRKKFLFSLILTFVVIIILAMILAIVPLIGI